MASILGGSTTTAVDPAVATILFSSVVDDTREISYDAASAELRSQPVSGEDAFAGLEDSGGTDRIGFRMSAGGSGRPETDGDATTVSVPGEVEDGETAVQILLGSQAAELPEAPSLGALAAELVDVRGQ